MKLLTEYLEHALAFERLASSEPNAELKSQFERQAIAYRKLAADRAARYGLPAPSAAPGGATMKCQLCADSFWVCENHPDKPWDGDRACGCGGAGAPCPACNATNDASASRMLSGFRTEADKDGWRH